MTDEYWKDSPFGEDSIFHPSWEEKQKEKRLASYEGVKITGFDIDVDYFRDKSNIFLSPSSKFNKPSYIVSFDSNSVTIAIKVIISLSKQPYEVKVAIDKKSAITASRSFNGSYQYEAKFNVNVYKSKARIDQYNSQEFIFTVKAVDNTTKDVSDLQTKKVRIDTNGMVMDINTHLSVFRIYSDGKIEENAPKITNSEVSKVAEYIYVDNNATEHKLGQFKIRTIKNIYGINYGGATVDLVDIRELKSYFSDSVHFSLSLNTERYFMNTLTLASLLGAMLECSFNDFVFNGFSNEKGESIGGSSSHKNGYNGDLRYLRKDRSSQRMDLRKADETGDPCGWEGLDEERQNQFNNALYKFGWKSMLSWKYNDNKLLNHCIHYKGHYNHLHVQGYRPNYEKI